MSNQICFQYPGCNVPKFKTCTNIVQTIAIYRSWPSCKLGDVFAQHVFAWQKLSWTRQIMSASLDMPKVLHNATTQEKKNDASHVLKWCTSHILPRKRKIQVSEGFLKFTQERHYVNYEFIQRSELPIWCQINWKTKIVRLNPPSMESIDLGWIRRGLPLGAIFAAIDPFPCSCHFKKHLNN